MWHTTLNGDSWSSPGGCWQGPLNPQLDSMEEINPALELLLFTTSGKVHATAAALPSEAVTA